MSSCGDEDYWPDFALGDCTTLMGDPGYCCLPAEQDGGTSVCSSGGYCTSTDQCEPGYQMTEMGCEIGGAPGSCCLPP
jgi:hypothetical protein